MDRYHVALSALLAVQAISWLATMKLLWRLKADLSSIVSEIRNLVRPSQVNTVGDTRASRL